jgi:hypothetical protein
LYFTPEPQLQGALRGIVFGFSQNELAGG